MPNEFGGTTQCLKSNERPSARWERFSSIALCQNIVTDFDTFDSVTGRLPNATMIPLT